MSWQPIETAPMDGQHVQLYRPKIQFVGYHSATGWVVNAPGLPLMSEPPTHWMPLPDGPDESEGANGVCVEAAEFRGRMVGAAMNASYYTDWINEDELPEGYPYNLAFGRSVVIDGVRLFPPWNEPGQIPKEVGHEG